MWSQITLETFNTAEGLLKVEKVSEMQKAMNAYYDNKITPDYIKRILEGLKSMIDVKIFFYDDGDYEIDIVTEIDDQGNLRLTTTGLGKFTDIGEAVRITHLKLIDLLIQYQKNYIYALYKDDNYPKGELFYKALGSSIGELNGFKTSRSSRFEANRWKWEATI